MFEETETVGTKRRMALCLRRNLIIILFFAAFLLYGILTVKDYGVSTDEVIERESSLVTYKYIVPSVSDVVTDSVDFTQVPDLKEYSDRYYGMAVQLPMVFVEHLFHFQLDLRTVYLMRHLATFLTFYIATFFFYKTCRLFTKNIESDQKSRYASLFGVVLFLLCPLILANSYYNIKDIMFLSTFAISLYFGLACIEKPSWPKLVAFAFFSALCTNVRIVGAMAIAVCLLVLFFKTIAERGPWKRVFLKCLVTAVLCFGFYFLMTPVIWENTFEEIRNLISTFSNYVVWYAYVFFMGKYTLSTELPWYYLFVCIGTTLPLLHLVGFFAGSVHQLAQAGTAIRRKTPVSCPGWLRIALFCNLLIPFLYVLISKPVLYNSWRHFFFIYPLLVLYALDGILWLGQLAFRAVKRWFRYIFCAVVGAAMVYLACWTVVNHPYEYVFYNRIGLPFVNHYFTKDYWNVSHYELLQYACDIDDRDSISVWMLPFETSTSLLRQEDRERVVQEEDQALADYIVTAYTDYYENERIAEYYLFDELKEITVDGVKISSLFGRAYDITSRSAFYTLEDGTTLYNEIGMEWTAYVEDGQQVLEGTYPAEVVTDKVWIQDGDGRDVSDIQVFLSEDYGTSWKQIETAPEYSVLTSENSGTFDASYITNVKLVYPEDTHETLTCSLLKHRDEPGVEATWQVRVIKRAWSEETPWEAVHMVDGETETRWSSGVTQEPGITAEFDLTEPFTVCGVHVETGSDEDDYPRDLHVLVSMDAEEWTDTGARAADEETYLFDPVECAYIKLVIGQCEDDIDQNWSVYELDLLTAAD